MDWYSPMVPVTPPAPVAVDVDELPTAEAVTAPAPQMGDFAGDKYFGGFGETQIFSLDYWTLRARSGQLFTENLYARGLIRRLVTNVINTGLTLEAQPDEAVIGVAPDSLNDWSEYTENLFTLYADNPRLVDYEERRTLGELQREAFSEALICGDTLVTVYLNRSTGLPQIRLISGNAVQTPAIVPNLRAGHTIDHGVERDARGRHVAYYVEQDDSTEYKRIAAYGARSGRRVAWLVYATDKRVDAVRGECLLGLVMQSLKEIDRYRDSAQRKAAINAILAMWIKKTEDKPGTLPVSGGAVRKTSVAVSDTTNTERTYRIAEQIPGYVVEELQVGEEPVPHSTAGTDVNFGPFEEAIISAIAWACEVPPEILKLAFLNNYSASQAAINEFKMYLNKERTRFGAQCLQPVYIEWLISAVLAGHVTAAGFLAAWRDPKQFFIFAAWVSSDWSGAIKPSTDLVKQAKGYKLLEKEGWITNDRAARELTGTKFSKNIKRLRRENELKVEAMRPLMEFKAEFGEEETIEALRALEVVQ